MATTLFRLACTLSVSFLALTGCGGGSGNSTNNPSSTISSTTISTVASSTESTSAVNTSESSAATSVTSSELHSSEHSADLASSVDSSSTETSSTISSALSSITSDTTSSYGVALSEASSSSEPSSVPSESSSSIESSSIESSSSSVENSSSSIESSSIESSSSSSLAPTIEVVQIFALGGGSAQFSIRLPEQKTQVHLFTRRNGLQDYEIIDLQSQPGSAIDNGDNTWSYQITRTGAYSEGDLIEARFFTFQMTSGQIFYPGPIEMSWVSITYSGSAGTASSASSLISSANSVSSSTSTSLGSSQSSSSVSSSTTSSSTHSAASLGNIVPLYDSSTTLEPAIKVQQGNQLITRIADRARDRHAKENQFQAYEHYLSFYWEHRTASIEIIETQFPDDTASIRMNVKTQWRLNDTEAENRWFYRGIGTVAEYCDNGTMVVEDDLNYHKERSFNCRTGLPIRKGDKLEFELSQFLAPNVPNGRAAYYGTTYLYVVGEGIVPWDVLPGTFNTPTFGGGTKDSAKIPEEAWLGGGTTLHANASHEPDNAYIQMATNTGYNNAQPFMLGRRVLHSSFVNGTHDENPVENPVLTEFIGKAGPRYVSESCSSCHERNGRAVPNALGQPLDKWVFKVADANGDPHPQLGRVLQPKTVGGAMSEGVPSIAFWSESSGLRSPNYQFSGPTPDRFSARIAPAMVGMGLLEAIPEAAILANENPDGSGISGRANHVIDPETGLTRLGRFGWKAGTSSVRHQVASALNTDMGVMTAMLPNPDCGSSQTDCSSSNVELSDTHLDNLVKYVSLLGIRPQRNYNDPAVQSGKNLFSTIGCAGCHTPTWQTSAFHPLAELRDQTIHPYTDLLLHDMGPGLADNLGEGLASGAEWRTPALWGLGSSACVTGGMTNAGQGAQVCIPAHGYLHDGRARTIEEAILWHGGEGQASNDNYQALSNTQKQHLLSFLESL